MSDQAATPTEPTAAANKPVRAKAPVADAIENDAEIMAAVQEEQEPSALASAATKAKKAVKDEAVALKDQATDKARATAMKGKGKAVEKAGAVSAILADTAASIDAQFGKEYGDYARSAQEKLDEYVGKFEKTDIDDLVDGTREFVRKQPAIALGVAAAAGFALIRVLKAGFDPK